MAAPAAVAVVEALPVLAVVDLAHLAVLARAQVVALRAHRVRLRLLARLPLLVRAHLAGPALVQVLAGLVVVEAAVLRHLLSLPSRQSFSAATARSSR